MGVVKVKITHDLVWVCRIGKPYIKSGYCYKDLFLFVLVGGILSNGIPL
jgi:hypothetical protein